jgi:hypothetical protein
MAPAVHVDQATKGRDRKNRLEAFCDGRLVGVAERRFGRGEDDWIGWLVAVGDQRLVVDTVTEARQLLERWASEAVAG